MVFDARDIELTLDSYVRYVDTGTIGKIVDLKTENGIGWVKLDKTNLWYRANLVELLDEKDIKKSTLYKMVIFSFMVQIIVIQTKILSQKEV